MALVKAAKRSTTSQDCSASPRSSRAHSSRLMDR